MITSKDPDSANVFSEDAANTLLENGNHNLGLETTDTSPFRPLYNISQNELEFVREYIADNLANGFIQPSTQFAEAPILSFKKKDENLGFYVDYRSLNPITKKNCYLLPLISEALDQVVGANLFTKLDMQAVYNRIRVRDGDKWKTVFRSRYGITNIVLCYLG